MLFAKNKHRDTPVGTASNSNQPLPPERLPPSGNAEQASDGVGSRLQWLLLAVGIVYFSLAAAAVANSRSMDYAVVVDMVRNMAAGKDFPVFFYGQAYMGTFEPAVSAVICALFGPSPVCVCLGSAVFGIATLLVVLLLGKRLAGSWGGVFSVFLAITGSFHWVHFMVSPRGGYALTAFLVVSSLAIGSIIPLTDVKTGRIRARWAVIFGLLAGLAFWNVWLAFPAFAAAAVFLAIRLRGRLFSPRFMLPAIVAFFIGGAPFWLWTIRNGGGAFDLGGGGLRPIGWRAIERIFGIVAVQFFDLRCSASEFWRTPLPWTMIAVLAFCLVAMFIVRHKALGAFSAAAALYVAIFAFVYANSAFGAMGVARYLVPFVPVFSVVCGSALGAWVELGPPFSWRSPRSLTRLSTCVIVFAAYCAFVAVPSVRSSVRNLLSMREKGADWRQMVDDLVKDPSLSEAAFADFSLFGYNWASNRRLCFVSPSRWRYDPYIERLEEASHPAVINRLNAFLSFCEASGGACRVRQVGDVVVADQITPPPETAEILPDSGITICASNGTDVGGPLLDDNLATCARIRGDAAEEPYLDVSFDLREPVAGVSILMDPIDCARGWAAEISNGDDGAIERIADIPHQGWFWSGPRQYQFGPDARWTIRWKPRKSGRVRLVFTSRKPGMPISIPDLRLISTNAVPPLDIDAVSDSVRELKKTNPDAQIHAGRWLGRLLGAAPDPALRFGMGADDLGVPEVCQAATLTRETCHIVVMRDPVASGEAEETLRSLAVPFEKFEAGGCGVFAIPRQESPSIASRRESTCPDARLRFFGGRIMRDAEPPLVTGQYKVCNVNFGGALDLIGFSPLPGEVKPGDLFRVDMMLKFLEGKNRRGNYNLFVHGIRDGKIEFQSKVSISPAKARRPADCPHRAPLSVNVAIPREMSSGPVTLAVCVKPDCRFSQRLKPEADSDHVADRRLILGDIIVARGN